MKTENELKYFKKVIQKELEDLNIINNLSSNYSVSREAVFGCMYNQYKHKDIIFQKYYVTSFLVGLLLPLFLLVFYFKKNKKNKKRFDILFENFNKDTYNKFYKTLDNNMQTKYSIIKFNNYKIDRSKNSRNDLLHRNDYIDKKALTKSIKYILNNFSLVYTLYRLSKKHNLNLINLFILFLLEFIKYKSFATNANTKIWISAFDYNAHLVKYEILQMHNIKFIVFQESLRSDIFLSYKGADIAFCYGKMQENIYLGNNNKFKKTIAIGSMVNFNYIEDDFQKKYDYIFIDQRLDYDFYQLEGLSNSSYRKILENLHKFKIEFPQYKILYKCRPNKVIRNIDIYNDLIKKLKDSGVIMDLSDDSYIRVLESKVSLGYTSALCFESIGLNVPALLFYYDKYKNVLFDYQKSSTDILITDDSYEQFKNSMINILKEENQKIYLNKYKKLYMNQSSESMNIIIDNIDKMLMKDI